MRTTIGRILLLLSVGLLPAAPARAVSAEAEGCLACHSNPEVAPKPELGRLDASAHGKLDCTACHADASEAPHPKRPQPVNCGKCHKEPAAGLRTTHHGQQKLSQGHTLQQVCSICHEKAPHGILPISDPKSRMARANEPETCASCHGGENPVVLDERGRSRVDTYKHTVHGEAQRAGKTGAATCSDCHGEHAIRHSNDPASRVSARNVPDTCGKCHKDEKKAFLSSVHGSNLLKGVRDVPSCTDCHGEHMVRRPGQAGAQASVTGTCSSCHASERISSKFGLAADRVSTFMTSYHGLASKLGNAEVANCSSCHGWHDVLPSSDPASRINPKNLAKTCGACHPGAGERLAALKVHETLAGTGDASPAANLVRSFYMLMIPLVLLGMFFHNVIDFRRKALAKKPLVPLRDEEEVMLNLDERVQHLLLTGSFTLLAYTGFALKFPDAWWAQPFVHFGGDRARLIAHRGMALLFVVLGVYHAAYLTLRRCGRARLRALLPAGRDFLDPVRLIAFNLGVLKEQPRLPRFSYIEKSEYWALVWGSIVMVATGVLLISHDFVLAHFPLWVLDVCRVAHYLEAVLACAAIFVWHAYWTVFDPEIYPMNWAWITGKVHRHPPEEPHPAPSAPAPKKEGDEPRQE